MRFYIVIFLYIVIAQVGVSQTKELTLEDAIINRYRNLAPDNVKGLQWIKGTDLYTYREDSRLVISDARGNNVSSLSLNRFNQILGDSLKTFPYVTFDNEDDIRFTSQGNTRIVSLKKGEIISSTNNPERGVNMKVGPNGIVAYTVDNNLYIYDGEERAITDDENPDHVYGQAVSRMEFGITDGIFWSPNGNKLAFYMKDESNVTDYPLVDYMGRSAELNTVKYPMAGMESEHVKLGVYDMATDKTVYIHGRGGVEDYLTNITWSPDEKHIYIQELNRAQNHMQLNKYDAGTGAFIKTLFEEKSDTYVEPQHKLSFSAKSKNHFYLLSNKNGYTHVYKYDVEGKELGQLTSGEWEVSEIVGFDNDERVMYVTGNKSNPLEHHLYKVDTKRKRITALTKEEGSHFVMMSDKGEYFIDRFQSADVPSVINVIDKNGNKINNILTSKDNASEYKFGENKIIEITSADGKTPLYGRLILPTDFDASKKYPVIVYVYGGPHSQMVRKTWKNAARWWQYYMAQEGYIAFTLDNRGTMNRGRDFEQVIHRNLGINETADQMKGVDFLKSLPYVDQDRIGVHGWSYGGFMTMNLMMRHPETFKVGVAGGPVVDWKMYEVMYGERYMDTPQENEEGYDKTDMTKLIPQLDGDLLIIHGAQDATVVMQHSMKFLRECVKHGKQVDFFTYPTHKHNVRGMDRVHLMDKVSNYFFDKL